MKLTVGSKITEAGRGAPNGLAPPVWHSLDGINDKLTTTTSTNDADRPIRDKLICFLDCCMVMSCFELSKIDCQLDLIVEFRLEFVFVAIWLRSNVGPFYNTTMPMTSLDTNAIYKSSWSLFGSRTIREA